MFFYADMCLKAPADLMQQAHVSTTQRTITSVASQVLWLRGKMFFQVYVYVRVHTHVVSHMMCHTVNVCAIQAAWCRQPAGSAGVLTASLKAPGAVRKWFTCRVQSCHMLGFAV